MWSTYLLIFLMFCIGAAGWLIFLWAVKSGQFDDVEGPKYRMLDDEDEVVPPSGPAATQEPPAPDTGPYDKIGAGKAP